jgi:hypothetical protein
MGGLFHGHCWLSRKDIEHGCAPLAGNDAPAALLAALSTLLDQHGTTLRKRTKVSLVVSDSLAALLPLAWHAELNTPDEIHAYAKACFLKRGEEINDAWIMHAAFRHYGEAGLAYALPRAWVQALVALLAARGLVLDRVLPITAQAYWKVRRRALAGQEIVLLREANRTSTMVFDATGLLGIDAETGAGMMEASGRRLVGRLAAYHPEIKVVQEWSEEGVATRRQAAFVTELFAEAGVEQVHRSAWN